MVKNPGPKGASGPATVELTWHSFGDIRVSVDRLPAEAHHQLTSLAALTLFNDKTRGGEVMKRLNQFGGWAGDVFKQCKDGVHEDVGADLQWMINQTERLADKILEMN